MESSQFPERKENFSYWLKHLQENETEEDEGALPTIPQPETPNEPMEFLSRSWSLSANEISNALANKHAAQPAFHDNLTVIPQTVVAPQHLAGKVMKPVNSRPIRAGAIGRLLHHKEFNDSNSVKKKDKTRTENARIHAVLSVARLAAALAASASTEKSKDSSSKMSMAMASATQLLASYCIELAESAGAERDCVASVVRSAVGIRTASDLLTLTAAAATALRGEATLKERLSKEAKRSAAISPYEKVTVDSHGHSHSSSAFHSDIEQDNLPCVGDILQLTQKGVLRWKHVSVYINKAYQVTIKLKSKHVGGAFCKNNKCIVYEVIDEIDKWPFRKERENMEVYFGVKTARGLLEFKCKNKVHKQKWVQGIQTLLQRTSRLENAENSLGMLNINKSI